MKILLLVIILFLCNCKLEEPPVYLGEVSAIDFSRRTVSLGIVTYKVRGNMSPTGKYLYMKKDCLGTFYYTTELGGFDASGNSR
jgi:hypothetical protein